MVNGLLLVHYLTHAVLIAGSVGWLVTALSAAWMAPANSRVFLALVAVSTIWQLARLISLVPAHRPSQGAPDAQDKHRSNEKSPPVAGPAALSFRSCAFRQNGSVV